MTAEVRPFYHADTSTLSYIVYDQPGGHAVVIDPVLDFKANSGAVWTEFADKQIAFLEDNALKLEWILETHAHADHLSAARYLKQNCGGKIAIGEGILAVQKTFQVVFAYNEHNAVLGEAAFDCLFKDNEVFSFGELQGRVMATPGHTKDSVTYIIDLNAFVGDTLFMPDGGTARCDFPGGDAAQLFRSIQQLHALPDKMKLWVCHDYQPNGREMRCMTTVTDSKHNNIHVNLNAKEENFVQVRSTRDATLDVPKLIYPSIQVNIQGGRLPQESEPGKRFIKIPMQVADKLKN